MNQRFVNPRRQLALIIALGVGAALTAAARKTQAGVVVPGAQRNAVGGVSVDAQGVVQNPDRRTLKELQKVRQAFLKDIPAELREGAKLRRVSLKQIQQAAAASKKNGGELPDEVRFLGGLQRIQYVLVYPELNDIVLVGPAEGWKIAETGEPVGLTTGQPVMQFDDLVVAMRTASAAERGPITCSIDPTPEGIKRLHKYLQQTKPVMTPQNKRRILNQIEDELGMQKVTLSGVDPTSRIARVLVAADYRMKRLAMGFDPAPIKDMPSYLQMASADRQQDLMPRWWLEDDYQPLATDEKGLAWEIRGQGVKCMTEDEVISPDGTRRSTKKQDPVAQQWATTMTERYTELASKEPVFGQLRNCMDLAVVAALIVSENLAGKAGLDLGDILRNPLLMPDKYDEARELPTLANAVLKQAEGEVKGKGKIVSNGRRWLISASGGVSINPWQAASKREQSDKLTPVRDDSLPPAGAAWWWN